MKGGPTSASTGSPLARPTFIPGTPRFVWFIALFAGTGPTIDAASYRSLAVQHEARLACGSDPPALRPLQVEVKYTQAWQGHPEVRIKIGPATGRQERLKRGQVDR